MDREELMATARAYRGRRARRGSSHTKAHYVSELRHSIAVVVSLTIQNREKADSQELTTAYSNLEKLLNKALTHVI